jgi:uncharacterized membrane protein YidH (DUF202 family)
MARDVQSAQAEGIVKLIGVILIVFGIVALAIGGIRYTDRDKVVDLGPVNVTTTEHKTFPLPPIVGFAAIGAGIVLVVAGARTRV